MTAWGAGSLVQMVSTTQSSRTTETVVDQKEAVSAGSCRLFSTFPVSADNNGRWGGFLPSSLCIQKFRSRRLNFGRQLTSRRWEIVVC
jgi:hypothetical protein